MKFHIKFISDGKWNGSKKFNVISHGIDNHEANHDFNLTSNGMETIDNFNLLSNGMENGVNNLDLVLDKMQYGPIQGFKYSLIFPSVVKYPKMGRMEAVEGPAYSSTPEATLSHLAYLVYWVQIWCLLAIVYVMI